MKDNSITKDTMSRTGKVHKNVKQKIALKRRQAEANARRKIAKRWDLLSHGVKYKKAAVKESCVRTTQILEDELFNGILLNLRRNGTKSYSTQKRILRRIVEKRQAQSTHRLVGRTDDRFANHIMHYCTSKSMNELQLLTQPYALQKGH